jgi:hypothetical protein
VLRTVEMRVATMMDGCLDADVRRLVDSGSLAKLAFMAFDGFSMQAHLKTGETCTDTLIDGICAVLAPARAARSSAA